MLTLNFSTSKEVRKISSKKEVQDGFTWLDFDRSEENWYEASKDYLDVPVNEHHLKDSQNATHPPFYDGDNEYDVLVIRSLRHDCEPQNPTTDPIFFFLTKNTLITIHQTNDPIFKDLQKKLLAHKRRIPGSVPSLFHLLMDTIANRFINYYPSVTELLSNWQDRLLDKNDVFDDWEGLMKLKTRLRRLEVVSAMQLDILAKWEDQTAIEIDPLLLVRFTDLDDHQKRILNQAIVVQHDIDSLVQVYFSATTQRTNEILQVLAIISAIFLPLNLLAGIFGMNFTNMPLLNHPIAPYATILFMLLTIGIMVYRFRMIKWIK